MQEEDINFGKNSSKKQPGLSSLYTEEEMEGVSTTSSFIKGDSTAVGEINFSEVSSTSEDTNQQPSTSSKSIFMDLYDEDIVDSGSENVAGLKNKSAVTKDVVDTKKPQPGLVLLGEYADSGNDTEEETLSLFRAKQENSKQTVEALSKQISSPEHASSEAIIEENETSKKSDETEVVDASNEVLSSLNKASSPVLDNVEEGKDLNVHALQDNTKAKLERSVSREEGQISAESDSSDSELSSASRKDSKKQKDAKRDKSKKKDKKKKKKKRKKQKHSGKKEQSDVTEGETKKERIPVRSRSREGSEKEKSLKRSRSRSRDRDSRQRRRSRSRSRSRSRDKRKESRRRNDRSRRSRSRSAGRRRYAVNRNKDFKSRSRSPKRSASPSNRKKERKDKHPSPSRSRKDSPLVRRRNKSRSRSPYRTSERRRSQSPRRRSRSPGKRKRISPDISPAKRTSSKKPRSPNRRERKASASPPRKSSHRTSSASDSLDSGHFTNIPLSNTNKPDEPALNNKEPVQKSSPIAEKPTAERQNASSIPPKLPDLEKQFSPSYSPEKSWEDEFDFVFTERMSPKQGTEKSVEDVLFGTEAKTPDFKRPTPSESKKSKSKEPHHGRKKDETKPEKLTGITAIALEKNDMPQKQDGSPKLQATPEHKGDEKSISSSEDSKSNILASKTAKTDIGDKTDSNADLAQTSLESNRSAFVQSKAETIPFLDEAHPVPPPVSDAGLHIAPPTTQLGILGPPTTGTGLRTPPLHCRTWMGLGEVDPLSAQSSLQNLNSSKKEIAKAKKENLEQFVNRQDEGRNNLNASPMDMEMSSPEGDIIDQMNEEFWKQQQNQSGVNKTETEEGKSKEFFVESVPNEQSPGEEPYEPESGLIIGEEFEEDLTSITDPKERRKREKQQQKEKTKVQELIDKLHRQARVEEEVKHALKAYYKHRDIDKEEYKSILRRAVPQVTNSSSAIDPERIRSLVKKYVAKIKGQRDNSY